MSLSNGRKIRRKIENCRYADEVTALIARRVQQLPEYKGCKVERYGPVGQDATCSIAVHAPNGDLMGYLSIVYRGDGFKYNDYTAPESGAYPKGSIGDMNGFNVRKRTLPLDINAVLDILFQSK